MIIYSPVPHEDGSSADSIGTSHLHSLSDKNFREVIWRMFKELKEPMKQTMKVEMRKLQNELTGLKTW